MIKKIEIREPWMREGMQWETYPKDSEYPVEADSTDQLGKLNMLKDKINELIDFSNNLKK